MNDFHLVRRAVLVLSCFLCFPCFLVSGCGGERRTEAPAAAPEPATTEAPSPEEKTAAPPAAAPAAPAAGAADIMDSEQAPASRSDESQSAAPPPAPNSTKKDQDKKKSLARQQSDLDALAARLDGVVALSTPDCPTAWALRDQICDLSRHLCDVATKSRESDVAERCADGKARCDRATAKVRAVCSK
jgi:hypothetical protein